MIGSGRERRQGVARRGSRLGLGMATGTGIGTSEEREAEGLIPNTDLISAHYS